MHCPASVAITLYVLEGPIGVAVLPGIDPGPLAALQQLGDTLRRVPFSHVLTEQAVEVGMAVNRVAANNQARNFVLAELDGRQRGIGLAGRFGRDDTGAAKPGRNPCGLVKEVTARCGLTHDELLTLRESLRAFQNEQVRLAVLARGEFRRGRTAGDIADL